MKNFPDLPDIIIEPMVRRALEEDFGTAGDLTSSLLVPETSTGTLEFMARNSGVISGLQAARMTYALVDPRVKFEVYKPDGTHVRKGTLIARVQGPARALLMAERVALNFLGRMSGIASLTAKYVKAVSAYQVRIAATRKTTPGLRALEKRAVLHGGGHTHRGSLADAIMVKDNHIALAGGLENALDAIMSGADHMSKVSIEVDTVDQFKKVLKHRPDVILLDNMNLQELRECVAVGKGKVTLEASGGVNLRTVADIAATGVDVISVGALTHSAINFDIGLDAP
ncbi:MAG TPA: carboxylating nicotinate-nucleotide diphosphorylase [Hellea balneolensis]|uniref:Probable nicotinate-nucleotide pyrophosphorylase [carboxylating] n=1 Tax=Hellea balneolensis TaxID=287478 RepID=A0A7C5R179_9PROT|nr:carboxylating nicotinate-nucleotide diphosphorylase [Hellea balneolensis]